MWDVKTYAIASRLAGFAGLTVVTNARRLIVVDVASPPESVAVMTTPPSGRL